MNPILAEGSRFTIAPLRGRNGVISGLPASAGAGGSRSIVATADPDGVTRVLWQCIGLARDAGPGSYRPAIREWESKEEAAQAYSFRTLQQQLQQQFVSPSFGTSGVPLPVSFRSIGFTSITAWARHLV